MLYADGEVWARFAQVAHRMYPPIGGSSVMRESVELPPDSADAAEALVRAIDLEGYSEIEFRRDAHNRPLLMEINPRLSASVEIAVQSGVDFPTLLFAWAAEAAPTRVTAYRRGVRMRWLGGDLRWLQAAMKTPGLPDVPPRTDALRAFAQDFVHPTGYDYVDRRDLRPALVAAGAPAIRALRRWATRASERGIT